MDSGLYAALTGLMARQQSLEIAANNLANLRTSGYKAQHESFSSVLASVRPGHLSTLNKAVNDFGVLGEARVDMSSGAEERTGNDLDLAISGEGFFAVSTKGGERYTRNGNFQLKPDSTLVTPQGDPVLSESGAPIQIPQGKVTISEDGTITAAGAVVAKLKIVGFPKDAQLEPSGFSLFTAPAGVKPEAAKDIAVHQGTLESANMDPVSGAVSLIALQRHADLLQRAISIFHNDFNRTAAQELSKI